MLVGSGSETPLGASAGFGGGGLPDILRIVLRVAKVSPLIRIYQTTRRCSAPYMI